MPRNLSKEELHDNWFFSEDGKLYWKKHYFKRLVGKEAGGLSVQGYPVLKFEDKQYKIHRLVYAYHTGRWPKVIDHINRDRSDNRFENLREVSHKDNSANSGYVSGRIPLRGVSFFYKKYRASIQHGGVREFLGYFDTAEQASEAYLNRRFELTGVR